MNAATNQTLNALDVQALGSVSNGHSLSAYLEMCPTCSAGPAIDDEYTTSVLPTLCPTCGQASVEYGMITAMDAILTTLNGLDTVGASFDALD